MFHGETIKVVRLDDGMVELCFDRHGAAINKLDQATLQEWRNATRLIAADTTVRGVLVTSAKDVFIVGADIHEFSTMFKLPHAQLVAASLRSNDIANAFEDLGVPSVVAINGIALGGGLEMTLSACWRVMSTGTQVGLPEVKLGLFPGLGGTVRMSRIAGPAVTRDWITTGKSQTADAALSAGVVDAICPPEALRDTALAFLHKAAGGEFDWSARQRSKRLPVALNATELHAVFDAGLAGIAAHGTRHEPAALLATTMMQQAATETRAGALALEADAFARVAKTQAAGSLVQIFHNEQALKKLVRQPGWQATDLPALTERFTATMTRACAQLVADGAEVAQIDGAMTQFGWPGTCLAASVPGIVSDQEIIERMMLPILIDAAGALESGLVATPAELDMALLSGIGLPRYLGGAMKYADWLGLDAVLRMSKKYAHLGGNYLATPTMQDMAITGRLYYPTPTAH